MVYVSVKLVPTYAPLLSGGKIFIGGLVGARALGNSFRATFSSGPCVKRTPPVSGNYLVRVICLSCSALVKINGE